MVVDDGGRFRFHPLRHKVVRIASVRASTREAATRTRTSYERGLEILLASARDILTIVRFSELVSVAS